MLLIKNATVHTASKEGSLENASVVCERGKIVSVGAAPKKVKAAWRVIDGRGRQLIPGMVEGHCHVGMPGEGTGYADQDHNETSSPCTPQLRAFDSYNPGDVAVREACMSGITTVCVLPGSANVIGGAVSVMKTKPGLAHEVLVKEIAGMKFALGENPIRVHGGAKRSPGTRMATAAILREWFTNALHYRDERETAAKKKGALGPKKNLGYEALLLVLERKIPARCHAHQSNDILLGIRVAKEFNLQLVVEHCTEGHFMMDEIVNARAWALLGPLMHTRIKRETIQRSFESPRIFEERGIRFGMISDHPVCPLKYLNVYAGLAMREGLSFRGALDSVTLGPAQILGLDSRLGTIEKGKDADLALFDSMPFGAQARCKLTVIDGEVVHEEV
ncbi:MAG: amidohydrolase family protein [Planctomycetes bacterium]|nr:amidohydrolase family protein [Planctomycetota bacterium]